MNIEVIHEPLNISWEDVSELLVRAGMSRTPPDICRMAFQGSQADVFVFTEGKLIGVGRAISDRVKQAAIYDVAVLPEYQGNGIGRIILEHIMGQLPGVNFILYASPGKETFYEKFGFRRLKTGMAVFMDAELKKSKGFIE